MTHSASLYEVESWSKWIEENAAAITGLPSDQALFLASQIFSIPIAFFLRYALPYSRVGETVRHLYSLFFGLFFTFVCFGWQIVNVLFPAFVLYIALTLGVTSSVNIGKITLIGSMLYLSASHIYRQFTDYGGYKLDITGPLMILTQKLSLFAYAYYDGQQPESELTSDDHKKQRVKKMPSLLAYLSYLFSFMGFQTGPCFFYQDYISFIRGTNLTPFVSATSTEVKTPSPNRMFLFTVSGAAFCGLVVQILCPMFPVHAFADKLFIRDSSFLYKVGYCYLSTMLYRFRYYFAWKLGETICYAAGFGFTGWSKDGTEIWDLVKNCTISKLERATSFKIVFDEWNIQTSRWLRFICYTRISNKSKATNAVFLLSAFWHGFYPGYYVTFGLGMLFVPLGRKIRKTIRPLFQTSPLHQMLYSVVTFIGTHLALSFAVTAQILMRLSLVFHLYVSLYFYIPIVSIILMLAPIPSPRAPKNPSESSTHKQHNVQEQEKGSEAASSTQSSGVRQRVTNNDSSNNNDDINHETVD